jgi:hypothetical protein
MQLTRALLVLAAATSSTLALVLPAPLGLSPSPLSLPTGTVTCGSHKFSVSSVSAAVAQGYKYYKAGSTVGMYNDTSQARDRALILTHVQARTNIHTSSVTTRSCPCTALARPGTR